MIHRSLRGAWQFLMILVGCRSSLMASVENPILQFPKEADRMLVLVTGAILIAGMALIVNQLRRRGRKPPE